MLSSRAEPPLETAWYPLLPIVLPLSVPPERTNSWLPDEIVMLVALPSAPTSRIAPSLKVALPARVAPVSV